VGGCVKIEKRYVVGGLFLIPLLPFVILGFVAYWLFLYARCGFDLGERAFNWIEDKVR
jgi:hypothetical protein